MVRMLSVEHGRGTPHFGTRFRLLTARLRCDCQPERQPYARFRKQAWRQIHRQEDQALTIPQHRLVLQIAASLSTLASHPAAILTSSTSFSDLVERVPFD